MDLHSINARWLDRGDHPYASPEGGGFAAHCPSCPGFTGAVHTELLGAMNDALAHKTHCGQLN